jgi:hypothetical protein
MASLYYDIIGSKVADGTSRCFHPFEISDLGSNQRCGFMQVRCDYSGERQQLSFQRSKLRPAAAIARRF